jgi:transposase
MIGLPFGVLLWLACRYTEMRKGVDSSMIPARQVVDEDTFGGASSPCRDKRGGRVKLLWFDGQGCACSEGGWSKAASSGRWPLAASAFLVRVDPPEHFGSRLWKAGESSKRVGQLEHYFLSQKSGALRRRVHGSRRREEEEPY